MDGESNEDLKSIPEEKQNMWSFLKNSFRKGSQEKPIAGGSGPEVMDPQSGYARLVEGLRGDGQTKNVGELLEKKYSQFMEFIDKGELGMNDEFISPEKRMLIREAVTFGDKLVIAKLVRQRDEHAQKLVKSLKGERPIEWVARVKGERAAMQAILVSLLYDTEYQGKERSIYRESWMKFLPQRVSV